MFIHVGDQLVRDIGSKKALLFHIKDLLKKQGKNTSGFSKMPKNQLKGIFYSLSK